MQKPLQKQIVLHDMLVTYYEASENSSGLPAIVFLHGWRSQGSVWFPVWEKLMEKGEALSFTLYALDLPGFGKSGLPRNHRQFSLTDHARIIEEFIKETGMREVTLVGHSFGGRVVIKVAAAGKVPLRGLVLVDSAGFKENTKDSAIKFVLAKVMKPFFTFSFMQPLRRKLYAMMGAGDYVATPGLRETFLQVIGEDLTMILPHITVPTLLVWGEDDRDTPVSFGERMRLAIPRTKFIILPNAGHFSFLDQTEAFTRELLVFLFSY